MTPSTKKIVVLGMMSRHPVAGVVWQTIHYLVGLRRLGYEPYYVEAGGLQPSSMLVTDDRADRSRAAADFIAGVMRRFDMPHQWAFHARQGDGVCYGMSKSCLNHLYRSAELILNLHGATLPLPEHHETDRLVYVETDPVVVQIEVFDGKPETLEFLEAHRAIFTFGENYGEPDCRLPVSERFHFRPTRQPVVMDFWPEDGGPGEAFTTIGNWRQLWREVVYQGEVFGWSKDSEFLKFMDLPARCKETFELALSRYTPEDRDQLESYGWRVRNALDFSMDLDDYRKYIGASRGEFTVAKDQNIRLRTGWFSDRSATYLASGRPVITQDTAFSRQLPIGEGLFAYTTLEEAVSAVESIGADYERHRKAARSIACEFFDSDRVLARLLEESGI